MYCINCGNRIGDGDKYCIRCGNRIGIDNGVSNNTTEKKDYSGKKIASIILGSLSIGFSMLIVFAPISLIMSVIGLILSFVVIKNFFNMLCLYNKYLPKCIPFIVRDTFLYLS